MTVNVLALLASFGLASQPVAPAPTPAPSPSPAAAPPATPAPAAPAFVPGPWKLNEPSCCKVQVDKFDETSSPDNPGAGKKSNSTSTFVFRITPTKLEGDERVFLVKLDQLKTSVPTPMGEMSFDSANPKADPAFGDRLKSIVGSEVTVTIAANAIKSITGNEDVTEGGGSSKRLAELYFGDMEIAQNVGPCLILSNGKVKVEAGATWVIGGVSVDNRIVEVDRKGDAKVEKIDAGIATIVHSVSGKPTVTLKLPAEAAELAKGASATGTDLTMSGGCRWNIDQGRLLGADFNESCGYQLQIQGMTIDRKIARHTVITPQALPPATDVKPVNKTP